MSKRSSINRFLILRVWLICFFAGSAAYAQGSAFTYQGKLTEASNPATGTYDMLFKLFDTPTVGTGTQQGATITNPSVQVTGGSFTVQLDFGANVFTGAARFLEIGVRPAGDPNPHTVLAPRQPLTSSPYAIQTLNTTQLGGLPANRYVATDVNGNVGLGTPSPGTRLDVVHPTTQMRFGPSTADNGGYLVSTNPSQAIIAGGARWNGSNWIARDTVASLTAHQNGVIQFTTNNGLTVGNTFDPTERMRIDANGDVGIGTPSPQSKLTVQAFSPGYGITHTDGTVTVGSYIDAQGGWLGTRSNHPLHFFTNDSTPRMTMDTSGKVGIGTTSPGAKLHIVSPSIAVQAEGDYAVWGRTQNGVGIRGQVLLNGTGLAGDFIGNVLVDGNVRVAGELSITAFPGGGVNSVCRLADGTLAFCGSSLRYKKDFQPFAGGLNFINQLRPITFKWKSDNSPDIGFGAEEVARVNPLFVTYNQKGEIEGVKYDRLSVLFVNAFKEQQAQINEQRTLLEQQQTLINRQQRQLEALTKVVCQLQPQAAICQEAKP